MRSEVDKLESRQALLGALRFSSVPFHQFSIISLHTDSPLVRTIGRRLEYYTNRAVSDIEDALDSKLFKRCYVCLHKDKRVKYTDFPVEKMLYGQSAATRN